MRLNRVLLLAAAINLMIFAMIFTISCSGDDGKNGKDGLACVLGEDDDGIYIVTCGGEEVGSIPGGEGSKGPAGPAGKDGAPGKDGDDCWLGDKVDGAYLIICGANGTTGEVKGNLGTCDVQSATRYEYVITCGASKINMCGTQIFDPAQKYCDETGSPAEITFESCDGNTSKHQFNPKTHYCGYASESDYLLSKPKSILPLCGLSNDDINKPNGDGSNAEWKDEYCRYYGPNAFYAQASDVTCGLGKAKLNENGWKSQYCGYASASATEVSVVAGACQVLDDGGPAEEDGHLIYRGPNEEAFGRGYCQANSAGKLSYTTELCGAGGKPNNGSYKREYCGFENKNNTTKKVYNDACDYPSESDSTFVGAHSESFNGGYCQANRFGITTYTDEIWCGEDAESGKNEAKNRLNEGSWKGEYCGVNAAGVATKYEGACDEDEGEDHVGPNSGEFASGYCMFSNAIGKTKLITDLCGASGKPNDGSWKGEYCGYASLAAENSDTKSVLTGACDVLEGDEAQGPSYEAYQGGYCMPDLDSPARLTKYKSADDACDNDKIPNQGSWKGEYCGYANKTAFENSTTSVIKPSAGEGGEKCAIVAPKAGDYQAFCQADATGALDVGSLCGDKKYNEGSWKGEHCFSGDTKVKACKAGTFANTSLSSTNPNICVAQCSNSGDGFYVGFTNECIKDRDGENVCGSGEDLTPSDVGLNQSSFDNKICRCEQGYSPDVNPFTYCYIKGLVGTDAAKYPAVKAPSKRTVPNLVYLTDAAKCGDGASVGINDNASSCTCTNSSHIWTGTADNVVGKCKPLCAKEGSTVRGWANAAAAATDENGKPGLGTCSDCPNGVNSSTGICNP